MPYEIKKEGTSKWCVYNKETGENRGCHVKHKDALAHMRALYANEEK